MHLLQDSASQYPQAKVAPVVQPNLSNIHWHWTPNTYLASGIGVFLAWVATQAIVGTFQCAIVGRFARIRSEKSDPPSAICAASLANVAAIPRTAASCPLCPNDTGSYRPNR